MNRTPAKPVVQIGPMLDRQPPASPDAEAAVLGSMLLDPAVIESVAQVLSDRDAFYTEAHRHIYTALLDLGDRHGTADVLQIAQRLRDAGHLEAVGGPEYLATLADKVPSAVDAPRYASIVADKHRLRQLITACGETIYDVYDHNRAVGDDADAVFDRAEQRLFEVGRSKRVTTTEAQAIDELARAEYADLVERDTNPRSPGVSTGLRAVDEILLPLEPGNMVLLAARPSMGKTTLGMNIAENVAAAGNGVLFCSMEMTKREVVRRVVASRARVPMIRYVHGRLARHEWELVRSTVSEVDRMPLYIDDTPALTVMQLRAKVRRHVQHNRVRLVILDYVQLMASPDRGLSPYEKMTQISNGIKALAKQAGVPIIALSQLNRNAEHRQGNRPKMGDLRDSGALEQDADAILFIHREAYYHKGDPEWNPTHRDFDPLNTPKLDQAEVIVEKQRNGPTGVAMLRFIDTETKFTDTH